MVGYEEAPADEATSVIITTMVSDHINAALEQLNYYKRIHLHTFFCGNILSHCMEALDRFKFVIPAFFWSIL